MSLNNFWNEYELFFYHEFINKPEFPGSKKEQLKKEFGSYFINRDFTIYQEKSTPFERINEEDLSKNLITFLRILTHLPYQKVNGFLEFHYSKYKGDSVDFLNYIYGNIKSAKTKKGGNIVEKPHEQLMLLEWCENKMEDLNLKKKKKNVLYEKAFINHNRIEQLIEIKTSEYDLTKLIAMLKEININYSYGNFLSVIMLGRSAINHIPPLFGFKTFSEVSNNYGGVSFKKSMLNLNISMRNIADSYLHETIRKKESLPNENQIDFGREFDVLLAEIIRKL